MIDVEAVQVKKYAQENPDVEPEPPAQAGQMDLAPADSQPTLPEASLQRATKGLNQRTWKLREIRKSCALVMNSLLHHQMTPWTAQMKERQRRQGLSESPKQQHMNQVTSTPGTLRT